MMVAGELMTQLPAILRPNPARTVIRPFVPEDLPAFADKARSRAQRIADRILAQDDAEIGEELTRVKDSLDERHRDVEDLLLRRFRSVNGLLFDQCSVSTDRAMLLGAYFSQEYSFEGAALFNPTIVRHPDQSNLAAGAIRFVLALRGLGEGHLSSVTFRTGTWAPGGPVAIDTSSIWAVSPRIKLPEDGAADQIVHLSCGSRDLSETVIFPVVPSQRGGIEDLRLVRFTDDDGTGCYIGTYTAFSGSAVRVELLRTADFIDFEMIPLRGAACDSKGMALFPRRIDGRYAMLGRQDNESIWLMLSDDLLTWGGGTRIVTPKWPWDSVQMGNCGSPIELDEGWLVITHGVGAVRGYSVGACLLDKQDPSKVLARIKTPLLRPTAEQRDGYVPNVVYSCGALVHDGMLLLPYGVADSFTSFATVPVADLLAAMA